MKRNISYLIIVLVTFLLVDQLSFPDLQFLTGEKTQQTYKKIDVAEWTPYTEADSTSEKIKNKPYKNPFVKRERKYTPRKKVKPTVVVVPSVLRGYSLNGIVANRAITISDPQGSISVLKIGDTLADAELVGISGTSATFKGPGGEFILSLK